MFLDGFVFATIAAVIAGAAFSRELVSRRSPSA